MITRKELIEIIDNGVAIDLDKNGNFKHNAIGVIRKNNKDPECGLVEDHLACLSLDDDEYVQFDSYDDLLDYKIKGKTVYERLKNESAEDICTRILDDKNFHVDKNGILHL